MEPVITVSSIIRSHESPAKVTESIQKLFPEWNAEMSPEENPFPSTRSDFEISGAVDSMETFMSKLRESRVLDTAFDAMVMNLCGSNTFFSISRQSASVGKISFVVGGKTLGGTLEIHLEGGDLALWLEQQTWHSGRDSIPRTAGDDLTMDRDGEPKEWFDSRGQPTMRDSVK